MISGKKISVNISVNIYDSQWGFKTSENLFNKQHSNKYMKIQEEIKKKYTIEFYHVSEFGRFSKYLVIPSSVWAVQNGIFT